MWNPKGRRMIKSDALVESLQSRVGQAQGMAARMPWRWVRMVRPVLTKGARRERCTRGAPASERLGGLVVGRSPAKIVELVDHDPVTGNLWAR